MGICIFCEKTLEIEGRKIYRSTECPHCGRDVRCCVNCRFYSPASHNRCLESQAEWVSDREKANFCDYFRLNELAKEGKPDPDETKKKWDGLFGRG